MNTTQQKFVNVGDMVAKALAAEKFNPNNFPLEYDLSVPQAVRAGNAGIIDNGVFSHREIGSSLTVIGSFYLKKVEVTISITDFLRKLSQNRIYHRPADTNGYIAFISCYPNKALDGRLSCFNTELGPEDNFPPVICFERIGTLFTAVRLPPDERTLYRGDTVIVQRI